MHQNIIKSQIKTFEEPITIKCIVHGKNLLAKIIGTTDHPLHYEFVINFSDGICIEATLLESGRWWVDNVKYRPYMIAIAEDLLGFFMVMHCEYWYKFEINQKGRDLLVWVGVGEEKYKFLVYFNADYQFTLINEKSGWEIISERVIEPNPIDNVLAHSIIKELEKRI